MPQKNFCSNCNAHYFHDQKTTKQVYIENNNRIGSVGIRYTTCPGCGVLHYSLLGFGSGGGEYYVLYQSDGNGSGPVAPAEVPLPIASDYNEARAVLELSPKASAALARRCLQHLLRDRGYTQNNLVNQVDAVLSEHDPAKAVPDTLRLALDAVRNFGNFSAHPLTDKTTLQIIDVEAGEAEWCLEILIECFECFYVRPARAAERKAALNLKLAKAGKRPAK